MPRIARGLVDNFIYHIFNRGNGRQQVFHSPEDYGLFVDLIVKAKTHYPVKIFAYCLMPNHFHIALMPIQAEELSKWMQWLMTSHVRKYHQHYKTSGHIWQGRFKSFLIQKDEHLLSVLRYIEANPLRAGLVNSAKDWEWSSHKEVIGKKVRFLVDSPPIDLPEGWDKYVDEPMTQKEIERLRQSILRQSPYGTETWQLAISNKLGLESTLKPRGRPIKK